MKSCTLLTFLVLFSGYCMAGTVYVNHGADWLGSANISCFEGVRQSPINIDTSHVRRDIDKSVTVYPSNITNPSVVYAEGELKV